MYTENGTNGKWQLMFVCCIFKMKTANFRLFAANRNRKEKIFVLGRQTIISNGQLLVQQTCPSMAEMTPVYFTKLPTELQIESVTRHQRHSNRIFKLLKKASRGIIPFF
jgi:hypothetical protein